MLPALITKLSKGVNDDTEEDVQQNNDDDKEEQKVKNEPWEILWFARVYLSDSFSYTSTQAKTNVERAYKTIQYGCAVGVVIRFSSWVGNCLFITVNIVLREVDIGKNRENIDSHNNQQCSVE